MYIKFAILATLTYLAIAFLALAIPGNAMPVEPGVCAVVAVMLSGFVFLMAMHWHPELTLAAALPSLLILLTAMGITNYENDKELLPAYAHAMAVNSLAVCAMIFYLAASEKMRRFRGATHQPESHPEKE